MAVLSKIAGLVLGAAAAGAAVLPERSVPPFFYFSFGDSYTTTSFNINGVQPAPGNPLGNPAYGTGTVAGGPTYVNFLTTKYNSSFVANYNFAVGGATISNAIVGSSIPAFDNQVTQFFEPKYTTPHVANWNSANAIFSSFFGINDIGLTIESGQGNNLTRIPALLDAYFAIADNLYAQGARRFMFVAVPPTDRSPLVMTVPAAEQAQWRDAINTFNTQFGTRLALWTATRVGAVAAMYDYHRWLTGVLDNPTAYGFPDATCINADGQSCVWFNNYHVSSRVDDLLAKQMQAAMNSLGFDGRMPTGGYFY